MNKDEIFATLVEIFIASTDGGVDASKITPESDIYEELGVSSISAIYMALEIENRFGFALSNEEAASLRKVKDLIALIESKSK